MSVLDQNSILGRQKELRTDADASNGILGGRPSTADGKPSDYATGTPSTQTGSGRFQNLQAYVDANPNADKQSANLARSTTADIANFNAQNNANSNTIKANTKEANDLFNKSGTDYTTALKGWQDSLKTQSDLLNRGTADQAAQQVKAFTEGTGTVGANNSNFADFNKIRSGAGYDQQSDLDLLSSGILAGDKTVADLQYKANQLNTEEGRNQLLQQGGVQYGPKASMGGSLLNQLMFQANPNAVRDLQKKFTDQQSGIQASAKSFSDLGLNLVNPLISQEQALQNTLNTGATGLQTQFENNFANQGNYDIVNNARQAQYTDYANQLINGNLGMDLTGLLGLNKYQATYDPYAGNIQQIPQGPANGNPTTLRTYNAMGGSTPTATLPNYLVKNNAQAGSLQDVLSPQDYANYQAFGALSGNNLKASGSSNLGAAVSAAMDPNGKSVMLNKLIADDKAFGDVYGNKTFGSTGYSTRSSTAPSWNIPFAELDPTGQMSAATAAAVYPNSNRGLSSTTAANTTANSNQYLVNGDSALNTTTNNSGPNMRAGFAVDTELASQWAPAGTIASTKNKMDTLINQYNARATTGINQQVPSSINSSTYDQLKKLGLI